VLLYAITIFLSAFLLFQVQPLMGKYVLPWFGGAPPVWTACMLFFEAMLLAGYAYAHAVRTWISSRGQVAVHLAVLAAAVVLLPIAPSAEWKLEGTGNPTWRILGALGTSIGLPYFALAATAPLLQAWAAAARPGKSPYRLYAVSNAGSLLALATYPFLVEPLLRLRTQADTWSALFVAFAFLCGVCAVAVWRLRPAALAASGGGCAADVAAAGRTSAATLADGRGSDTAPLPDGRGSDCAAAAPAARPTLFVWALWLALPACGSALLLAVTNEMCADIGVVPLLWILPLALYLVTFILCFHSERIYQRILFWPALAGATYMVAWLLHENVDVSILWQVVGYGLALFVCCMVCHGELARLKPHPRYLTSFYLALAAGGAIGGLLVALAAPLVFTAYFELHIGVAGCAVLASAAFWHERMEAHRRGKRRRWFFPLLVAATLAGPTAAAVYLAREARLERQGAVAASRNFFGILRVVPYNTEDPERLYYSLMHGRIMHGCQYAEEPLRSSPTTYYGEKSGVALAFAHFRPLGPMKVGVVGLGTGSIAVYGRAGDTFRFYEINADVRRLATTRFTYLADCRARCEVVMGDARLSLAGEPPQGYDVLALDAFSSDAVPVHLLTAEAFQTYMRHMKPDGVLAVHISNRFVDLEPVVLGIAERLGLAAAVITADDEGREELSGCTWVLVTADRAMLESEPILSAATPPPAEPGPRIVWTDDYSNLLRIVNFEWPGAGEAGESLGDWLLRMLNFGWLTSSDKAQEEAEND